MPASAAPIPGQDILAFLETSGIPEENWTHGDDLCDCTFQRIGFWTNPYIGRTLKVRLCCIWAKVYAMFPEYVQEIPAFTDYNHGDSYVAKPAPWDGETDMPLHLWHRQLAVEMHLPLSAVRELVAGQEPPKAVRAKEVSVETHDNGTSVGVLGAKALTVTQRVALMATQATISQLLSQVAQAQQQLQTILREAGLDPDKQWRMSPTGEMFEADKVMA